MSDTQQKVRDRTRIPPVAGGGGAVYLMGVIGTPVFFFERADSLGERIAAVVEALVWPGFVVYGALRMLPSG